MKKLCVKLVTYEDNNILSCPCGCLDDNGGLVEQKDLDNRTDLKESIFTLNCSLSICE